MTAIPAIPSTTAAANLITVLNDRIRRINVALSGDASAAAAEPGVHFGPHVLRMGRPIAEYAGGAFFFETDRGALYQVQNGAWAYVSGALSAAFSGAPTGLGAGDAGFLWSVTDYAHLLRWTGTGWEFLDAAGNYIAGCAGAPGGSGWQLCDGSATSYLQVAAGIASATAAYLKFGAGYSASIAAATVPTAGGASATAAVASGSGATPASGAHVHTIALPADPVANLQVVAYYRR
jgi:hypothetical protein